LYRAGPLAPTATVDALEDISLVDLIAAGDLVMGTGVLTMGDLGGRGAYHEADLLFGGAIQFFRTGKGYKDGTLQEFTECCTKASNPDGAGAVVDPWELVKYKTGRYECHMRNAATADRTHVDHM
jgi:hypothetical protein